MDRQPAMTAAFDVLKMAVLPECEKMHIYEEEEGTKRRHTRSAQLLASLGCTF